MQSNECEGAREDREDAVTDLDFASLTPGLVPEAEREQTPAPARPYLSAQIGCSEVAAMMVALRTWDGMPARVVGYLERCAERAAWHGPVKSMPAHLKHPELSPAWIADNAKPVRTSVGTLPKCIAIKAGVRAKDARDDYMERGERLEPVLWRMWIDSMRGDPRCTLDVESLRSQHDVLAMYPREWGVRAPSVRHPDEPRLVTYLDGWGADLLGEPVVVNCKLSRDRKPEPDAAAWIQMQGEIACTRATLGLLVFGERWNADYIDGPEWERGPIVPHPVKPDAGAERAILATVAAAWVEIDRVRVEMAKEKAA